MKPSVPSACIVGGLLPLAVLLVASVAAVPCRAEEDGAAGAKAAASRAESSDSHAAGHAESNDDAAAGDPNAPVHAGTETVTVTGEGARAADAPTSFVSVIRPADRPGTIASLSDLLGSAVGTRVRSWGGLNSFATVSIRGSTPEQVQVFLDGVPLNSPLGGGVNLADIPLAGVEEIDVHRGFTPASLGSASIGGAVDIRTLHPDGARSLDGTLAYGSYGTGEATGIGTFSTGPMRWVVSGEGSTTRGDFEYWDNNATPYNGADDGYTRRRNNESWTGQVRASGEARFRGGRSLSLAAEWGGRRQGVPGIDTYQSLTATYSMQRQLLRAEMGWSDLAGGRLTLHAGANGEASSGTYQDVDDQLAISPQDTTTRIRAAGLRFLMEADPSRRHHLTVLLEPRREAAEVIDHLAAGSGRFDARRTTLHAVGEDEIRFGSGRFLLAPSLRWEAVANDGAGAAPGAAGGPAGDSRSFAGRLGGLWAISPHWSLRGNAGRYFRVPNLLELYGNEGTLLGNPALRPEKGINGDLGIAFAARSLGPLRGVSFELSAFRTDSTDLIQLVTVVTRQVKAFNIGEARVTGVEASAAFRLFGRLGLSGNLTLQRPTDLSDSFNRGNDLPGTPRRQASTSESLDLSRVTIFHRLDYVGENEIGRLGRAASNLPAGRQEQTRLPARYLHDAGLRVRLGSRTTATLEVLNLFDRHVVDVARYPLPGRTIFFKLSGSL